MMNYSTIIDDVDGDREVGVGEDHTEFVSDGDSGDHVSDCASDGAENCVSFFLLKPHSEFKIGLFSGCISLLSDFDGSVFEFTGKSTQLSLHDNFSRVNLDLNTLWHF